MNTSSRSCIQLTHSEIMQAAIVGVMRGVSAMKNNRLPRYGATDDNAWQISIQGAIGEFALAKALDRFWHNACGTPEAGDVGDLEVRTISKPNHRLIVHPQDADDAPFFLIHVDGCQCEIKGWLYGSEAKQDQFWTDPGTGRPAFFVPQHQLKTFGEFNEHRTHRPESGSEETWW